MDELSQASRDLLAKFTQEATPNAAREASTWAAVSTQVAAGPVPAAMLSAKAVAAVAGVLLGGVCIALLVWFARDQGSAVVSRESNGQGRQVRLPAATQSADQGHKGEVPRPRPHEGTEPVVAVSVEPESEAKPAPPKRATARAVRRRSKSAKAAVRAPSERPAGSKSKSPAADALAAEVLLMGKIRAALRANAHASAWVLLRQHAKTYSRGAFVEQAAALRVDALCGLGRSDAAAEAVRHFLTRWGDSPSASRVRQGCR